MDGVALRGLAARILFICIDITLTTATVFSNAAIHSTATVATRAESLLPLLLLPLLTVILLPLLMLAGDFVASAATGDVAIIAADVAISGVYHSCCRPLNHNSVWSKAHSVVSHQ